MHTHKGYNKQSYMQREFLVEKNGYNMPGYDSKDSFRNTKDILWKVVIFSNLNKMLETGETK